MVGDFAAELDGETARLSIQHVYPEDEGEYTCVAYNDLGKAYTSACLVVDGNFIDSHKSIPNKDAVRVVNISLNHIHTHYTNCRSLLKIT